MQSISRQTSHESQSSASIRRARQPAYESIQERLDKQNKLFNDTWGWDDIINKSPPSFVVAHMPRTIEQSSAKRDAPRSKRERLTELFLACFGKCDDLCRR
ncbi:MAG: hypothetical protein EOO38_06970 [Cytophagaceae bacterium]|nr:MAG: hypothetical protein EOO38_06970 [Cytophagaceae bacterium]